LTPVSDWDNHLMFYELDSGVPVPPVWRVQINNQFGIGQELYVEGPYWLAVPTQKGDQDPPEGLDHFLVYLVVDYVGPPLAIDVFLEDQFVERPAMVGEPFLFANPVQKTHGDIVTPIENPDDHLVFYYIDGGEFWLPLLPINNQFGEDTISVYESPSPSLYDVLGVPSQKIEWSLVD
jgi:hypothetical protein